MAKIKKIAKNGQKMAQNGKKNWSTVKKNPADNPA